MRELTISEIDGVGGGWSLKNWIVGQLVTAGLEYVGGLVGSGQVDYAGVAGSQGTYYNTVGA